MHRLIQMDMPELEAKEVSFRMIDMECNMGLNLLKVLGCNVAKHNSLMQLVSLVAETRVLATS